MPPTLNRISMLIALCAMFLAATAGAFITPVGPALALLVGAYVGYRKPILDRLEATAEVKREGMRAGLASGVLIGFGQTVGGMVFLLVLELLDRPVVMNTELFDVTPGVYVLTGSCGLALLDVMLGAFAGRQAGARGGRKSTERRKKAAIESQPHPNDALWQKKLATFSHTRFSSGSKHEFSWYFEGELQTKMENVADIAAFLKTCVYVRDKALFMQSDFWQHPVTFEQIKKGDCEDHAIWAWRHMIQQGLYAELMVGRLRKEGGRHAWVMFIEDDVLYGFESTRKRTNPILSMTEAVEMFHPEYSVDGEFQIYEYAGANIKGVPEPIDTSK